MTNREVRLARGSLRIDGREYAHQITGPVGIDEGTHALLVDLGWTPPKEQTHD